MNTLTIGGFLLKELHKYGVREIPGVPGDYILPFVRDLEAFDGIENMTMVGEGDAAWAANLVGRRRMSACYATFMVGCLNMLNGICDATKNLSASSLVIIGGEVALLDRGSEYIHHHELEASSYSSQEKVFQTLLGNEYAKSITHAATAAQDIARLLALAYTEHRPVYIGVPKDMWGVRVESLKPSLCGDYSKTIPLTLHLASKAKEMIDRASYPIVLVGAHAERFGLIPLLSCFAKKYGIPVATAYNGYGAYPMLDPFFIGIYAAQGSCPANVERVIEASDCLIKVGVIDCDMVHGLRSPRLQAGDIVLDLVSSTVQLGKEKTRLSSRSDYDLFLERLVDMKESERGDCFPYSFLSWMNDETNRYYSGSFFESRPIQFSDIAPLVHNVLQFHPDTPVVADIGNAMAIPVATSGGYYTSVYGAMGVTAGAVGLEKALDERPLVIVGDGAFGMWSLGSLLMLRKYHSKMVIMVLNNEGWGMLRPIAGNVPYLDLPSGDFEKLTEVCWGGLGFRAETPAELAHALHESFAADTFSIINVILQKDDMTDTIRQLMSPTVKE